MPSFVEVLIIVVIILGIFIVPRMLSRPPEQEARPVNRGLKLNGWLRMAILVSILWLTFFAFYLMPWHNEWHIFLSVGLGPVVLCWGIFWIFLGFRKGR